MISVVSGVFAALALVFALIATYSARRCGELQRNLEALCSALSNERGRIAAHDAELDQITATLRKLSGRIGAQRRAEAENSDSEIPPSLRQIPDTASYKAALRAKLGLVPGKPAPRG